MELVILFLQVIFLSFLPVALVLVVLASLRNSLRPLVGAGLLLAAYSFDYFVRMAPFLINQRFGKLNWEGGILSFLWPWPVVFLFNCFTPKEAGLKLEKPIQGMVLGICFGLLLGGWNVLDEYLMYVNYPKRVTLETIGYQLFVPSLSEELVYRGLLFAILVRYVGRGWGIFLVSLLFINIHAINFNIAKGELMWRGTPGLLGNILAATFVLGFLRLKTDSIWPGVICHSLINTLPYLFFYLI